MRRILSIQDNQQEYKEIKDIETTNANAEPTIVDIVNNATVYSSDGSSSKIRDHLNVDAFVIIDQYIEHNSQQHFIMLEPMIIDENGDEFRGGSYNIISNSFKLFQNKFIVKSGVILTAGSEDITINYHTIGGQQISKVFTVAIIDSASSTIATSNKIDKTKLAWSNYGEPLFTIDQASSNYAVIFSHRRGADSNGAQHLGGLSVFKNDLWSYSKEWILNRGSDKYDFLVQIIGVSKDALDNTVYESASMLWEDVTNCPATTTPPPSSGGSFRYLDGEVYMCQYKDGSGLVPENSEGNRWDWFVAMGWDGATNSDKTGYLFQTSPPVELYKLVVTYNATSGGYDYQVIEEMTAYATQAVVDAGVGETTVYAPKGSVFRAYDPITNDWADVPPTATDNIYYDKYIYQSEYVSTVDGDGDMVQIAYPSNPASFIEMPIAVNIKA